jgi:transcriptional regulator with XRE-family HTH domain
MEEITDFTDSNCDCEKYEHYRYGSESPHIDNPYFEFESNTFEDEYEHGHYKYESPHIDNSYNEFEFERNTSEEEYEQILRTDYPESESSESESSESEDSEQKENKEKFVCDKFKCEEEEFEGCGEDCLGEDCECCYDPEDEDEDEDPCKTSQDVDKKNCRKCGKEQHICNYISLVNGTETKTCLTCRDINNNYNKTSALRESYANLKKNMPPCTDCGDDNPDHLEFNHINPPTKRGEVGKMTTIPKQLNERKGCNVKCKKCHIVHTAFQRPPKRVWANPYRQERVRLAREFVNNYKIFLCGCQNPKCKDMFDRNILPFYEFHHKDFRNKLFNIARMVGGGWSIEAIIKELEKCILLCAYCHKIETRAERLERRKYYTSLDRPLIKRKKTANKLNLDHVKEIRRIYNEENVTMKQVAEQFNVSSNTIWDIVNNKSHKDETYKKYKDSGPKLTREQVTEMTQLYDNETVMFVSCDDKKEFEVNKYELLKIRESYNIKNTSLTKLASDYNVSIVYMYEIINNQRHIDGNYVKTRHLYRLSEGDVLDLRRLYNQGNVSFDELEENYNLSFKYLQILISNTRRSDHTYFRTRWTYPNTKLRDKQISEIIDLYKNKNVEVQKLGVMYNITINYVQDIISNEEKKLSVTIDNHNQVCDGRTNSLKRLSDVEIEEMRNLFVTTDNDNDRINPPIGLGDVEVEEIRNFYNNENSSISDLAERYHITAIYVKQIISNTKRINKNYIRTKFPSRVTDEDICEMRNLYNCENFSFAELGKIYNMDVTFIGDIIANKIRISNDYIRTNFNVELTDEDVSEIRRLFVERNISINRLAESYGVAFSYMRDITNNTCRVDEKYIMTQPTTEMVKKVIMWNRK